MADFSHLNDKAEGQMVDISAKGATPRRATVCSSVAVSEDCAGRLTPEMTREIAVTARIAGVQAGKQTAMLIPYCHPVSLSQITCDVTFEGSTFQVAVTARTVATTGVEMEAMVAASIAAVTIYDMIKAVDPEAVVGPTYVAEKEGGKRGAWQRSRALPGHAIATSERPS